MSETAQSRPRLAAAVFDLSRGRQALLSVAQPALGALLALWALPTPRVMVLGLVAATAGYLAVFSLNDVLDVRADRAAARLALEEASESGGVFDLDIAFERHPLAHGTISLWLAWVWVGTLALVSAAAAFELGTACVALFASAVILEILYCSLRSVTWTKTFVSGVMVGLGGLAGWVAVAPLSFAAGAFFVFLALWEIAGRNLPNDLADFADDSRVGLTTVATVFGTETAARAIFVGSLLTAVSVVWLPMIPFVRIVTLLCVFELMVVPSIRLVAWPASVAGARFFNRASLVPAIVFAVSLLAVTLGG